MKYKLFSHAAAIATVLMLMPLCLHSQDIVRPDITINYIDGTVRIQKPESEGWMTAETSKVLAHGDKIQTSKKSRAELTITANAIIRIDQNSTIGVNKQTDSLPISETLAKLGPGDFWGRFSGLDSSFKLVSPLKSSSSLTLTFPDTAFTRFRISIGTDSTFEARQYSGTMVLSFSKPDSVRDSLNIENNQIENSVFLKSSEKILVTSSGKIVFKGVFSPEDIDEKTEWVDWNKTRDPSATK
jgi:hypothetical protein